MPLQKTNTRILLHVGFHKTGTSSLQDCLRLNRALLEPLWRVETLQANPAMRHATNAARDYSLSRDPEDLALCQAHLAVWLGQIPRAPGQGLMISSEDFAGHMPGVGDLIRYDALAPILSAFVKIAGAVFGGDTEFSVLITTRDPPSWLRSLYWQQSKGRLLTDDFDAFAARLPDASDHAAMAQDLREGIAPWPVTLTALEEVKDRPLGPAETILDLADLPAELRAQLIASPLRNASPSGDLAATYVALNRLGLASDVLKRRKEDLRQAAVSKPPQTR